MFITVVELYDYMPSTQTQTSFLCAWSMQRNQIHDIFYNKGGKLHLNQSFCTRHHLEFFLYCTQASPSNQMLKYIFKRWSQLITVTNMLFEPDVSSRPCAKKFQTSSSQLLNYIWLHAINSDTLTTNTGHGRRPLEGPKLSSHAGKTALFGGNRCLMLVKCTTAFSC